MSSETHEATKKRLKESDKHWESISRMIHRQCDAEEELQAIKEREKVMVRDLEKIRLEVKVKENVYQRQTQEQRTHLICTKWDE